MLYGGVNIEKYLSNKLLFTVLLIPISLISLASCAQPKMVSKQDFALNTIATITIYHTDDTEITDQAFRIIREKENILSRTIKGSDIDRLNKAGGVPTQVMPETYDLIKKATDYCRQTEGAYDITICPVIDLWDFSTLNIPDESEISHALQKVSYENIVFMDDNTIMLNNGAQVDLGSIAKGYIADQVWEYLAYKGIKSAVIDLGGNIIAHGKKYDGSSWKIGIQKPFEDKSDIVGYIEAENLSVVSSGIYERYFYSGDKLYHHLIDTSTGYPVENQLSSVTVVGGSSTDADALSTACYLLGLDKGLALINKTENTEAIFITADGSLHYSNGIGSRLKFIR